MSPVQVDWLTLVLASVAIISLGLGFYAAYTARRKLAQNAGRAQLPRWGRVAQAVGVISALFVGFIQVIWRG